MADKYKIKIIFLSSLLSLFFLSCNTRENYYSLNISESQLMEVDDGDLILRKGTGIVSSLIIDYLSDSTGFSHIGILIRQNDSLYVIHSIGKEFSDKDGVQLCPVSDFISKSNAKEIIIVRNKKINNEDIVKMAKEYLSRNIPFDRSFDFNDTTAFSCLELPYHIFRRLGYESEELTSFRIFMDPSLYEIIIDRRNRNF